MTIKQFEAWWRDNNGHIYAGHVDAEIIWEAAVEAERAESFLTALPASVNQQLLDTLQTIADFAVGNGDVCEIIAKRARAALAEAALRAESAKEGK